MQLDDELFFLLGERAALEVRPQVVNPSKAAALPTPLQACIPRDIAPTPLPIGEHVGHELVVLLWRPQPFPKFMGAVYAAICAVLRRRRIWFPHNIMDLMLGREERSMIVFDRGSDQMKRICIYKRKGGRVRWLHRSVDDDDHCDSCGIA